MLWLVSSDLGQAMVYVGIEVWPEIRLLKSSSRNRRAWRLYSAHSSAEQMEYAGLLIGLRGVLDVLHSLNPPAEKIFIEGDCRRLAKLLEFRLDFGSP